MIKFKCMKKLLLAVAVMAFPIATATPALADNCVNAVITSVCVPDKVTIPQLPNVTAPVSPTPVPPVSTAPAVPQVAPSAPAPTAPVPKTTSKVVESTTQAAPSAPPTASPPPVAAKANPTTAKTPGASDPKTKTRYITVEQAVSISLGALLLGALVSLLILYIMYRIGKREGETDFNDYMVDLLSKKT